MATLEIKIDLSDTTAAIKAAANCTVAQRAREIFADQMQALIDANDAISFTFDGGVLVCEMTPQAMALMRKYGVGRIT